MLRRSVLIVICASSLLAGCSALVPMASGSVGGETSFTVEVPTDQATATQAPTPTPQPTPAPTHALRPLPEGLSEIPEEGEFTVELEPRSEAGSWAVGETNDIELGHCGLGSRVDLDGSLWDPKYGHDGNGGPLTDDQVADLINEGVASFTLVDEITGELLTEHGAVITLWRHDGPRFYYACA